MNLALSTATLVLAMGTTPLVASGAGRATEAAHAHGVMRLDIAVDQALLTVQLASPLDSLLGFERAPRTPAERRAADAMLSRMGEAAVLFKPNAAAQCVPTNVHIESAALQTTTPVPDKKMGKEAAKGGEHADLDAHYEFTCAHPEQLTTLEIGLFNAFPRLRKIEVQVAGAKAQSRQTLQRPNRVITLTR